MLQNIAAETVGQRRAVGYQAIWRAMYAKAAELTQQGDYARAAPLFEQAAEAATAAGKLELLRSMAES